MSYEVDRYALEQELGRGAFGAVYVARHTILGTRVALKLLHSTQAQEPDAVERFLREARAAASIGSPHIVRVSDAGITSTRQAFLAMELLEGEDLASYLNRRGRLSVHDAIAITRQVLEGLAAAHEAGIVHRDMKPANVFLTRGEGGAPFAKLLDFGVSKMARSAGGIEARLTATGTIVGTPHYMAPEQLMESKSVDGRADLYSVGVMLYELLSGRLPHDAESLGALIGLVLTTEPIDLSAIMPDVPPPIAAVALRALAKDPAMRFQSAREMSDALRRCVDGSAPFVPSTRATPAGLAGTLPIGGGVSTLPYGGVTGPVVSPPPRPRRSMLPWAALAAVVLACPAAIGIAGLVMRERVGAAWSAFVGEPGGAAGPSGPATGGPPSLSGILAPPEIPMHDGTEEVVGVAGISIERASRRRAESGRWIVDVPITIRNAGEASLTFQQSELSADGYIPTAESDLPTFAMLAQNRSFDGYMVWRASEDIAAPQTITVRFRGWARRVPVTDGPRLPPRPPPGGPEPE